MADTPGQGQEVVKVKGDGRGREKREHKQSTGCLPALRLSWLSAFPETAETRTWWGCSASTPPQD